MKSIKQNCKNMHQFTREIFQKMKKRKKENMNVKNISIFPKKMLKFREIYFEKCKYHKSKNLIDKNDVQF